MTKDKREKQSPEKPGHQATPESAADLEEVLASFVQTFESSAHRWEQTVYPFISSFEASAKRWEQWFTRRSLWLAYWVFRVSG
jgi:hypothetical protein